MAGVSVFDVWNILPQTIGGFEGFRYVAYIGTAGCDLAGHIRAWVNPIE